MKIGDAAREKLLPIAQRVFWWDDRAAWLDLPVRFVAQVMMFGSDEDKATVAELLGEDAFREVLQNPPPGVFNVETWSAWHQRFKLPVRPLPTRTFTEAEDQNSPGHTCLAPGGGSSPGNPPPTQARLWTLINSSDSFTRSSGQGHRARPGNEFYKGHVSSSNSSPPPMTGRSPAGACAFLRLFREN